MPRPGVPYRTFRETGLSRVVHRFDNDSRQCYRIAARFTIYFNRPLGEHSMRRVALLLLAGASALVAAPLPPLAGQGFGVYEHNTCAMGRAGVTAARPCADGSAISFSPAGLAGLTGTRLSAGVTLIG